jgi:hypothetical protein
MVLPREMSQGIQETWSLITVESAVGSFSSYFIFHIQSLTPLFALSLVTILVYWVSCGTCPKYPCQHVCLSRAPCQHSWEIKADRRTYHFLRPHGCLCAPFSFLWEQPIRKHNFPRIWVGMFYGSPQPSLQMFPSTVLNALRHIHLEFYDRFQRLLSQWMGLCTRTSNLVTSCLFRRFLASGTTFLCVQTRGQWLAQLKLAESWMIPPNFKQFIYLRLLKNTQYTIVHMYTLHVREYTVQPGRYCVHVYITCTWIYSAAGALLCTCIHYMYVNIQYSRGAIGSNIS